LDQILRRGILSRGTLPCKLLAPSANRPQNGDEKNAFFKLLVTKTTLRYSFHQLPGERFPWNFNTKHESVSSWNLSKQNFNFSEKGPFFEKKTLLRVFGGTLAAHALQPWPLGLRWIWVLHLI